MMPDSSLTLTLIYFVIPGLFLVAGLFDVLTTRIPDWISLSVVTLFVLYAFSIGMPIASIGMHFGTGILVFFAGFLAFSLGLMGGGDGKLAAAGALWFGPALAPSFLMLAFIYGGVMVALIFAMRRVPLPAFMVRQPWLMVWVQGHEGLPFGLAMAAAVMTVTRMEPVVNAF